MINFRYNQNERSNDLGKTDRSILNRISNYQNMGSNDLSDNPSLSLNSNSDTTEFATNNYKVEYEKLLAKDKQQTPNRGMVYQKYES